MSTKMTVGVTNVAIMGLGKSLYIGNRSAVLVRELIQNAADAGASLVEISTKGGLMVRDNGHGFTDPRLFLDLGASEKVAPGAVGGFGIAKLAVICADHWYVSSRFGTLTGTRGEFTLDQSKSRPSGTTVWVDWDTDYDSFDWVVNYLDRHIRVVVDNEEAARYVLDPVVTPKGKKLLKSAIPEPVIIGRLNGLPQFRNNMSEGHSTYIYDCKTTASPYSDGYPMSVSRDSFRGEEFNRFWEVCRELEILERDNQTAEKKRAAKISTRLDKNGKMYLSSKDGVVDDVQELEYAILLVDTLCDRIGLHHMTIGVTGDNTVNGLYFKGEDAVFLNPRILATKGQLIATLSHEIAHACGYMEHGESFSHKMTYCVAQLIEVM